MGKNIVAQNEKLGKISCSTWVFRIPKVWKILKRFDIGRFFPHKPLMFKECGLQVLPETTRTAHSSVHLGLNHL